MPDNTNSKTRAVDLTSDPARNLFAITGHATNPLPFITKAIRCDAAGTLIVRTVDGATDETLNMIAGETLPIMAEYVRATSTGTFHGLT